MSSFPYLPPGLLTHNIPSFVLTCICTVMSTQEVMSIPNIVNDMLWLKCWKVYCTGVKLNRVMWRITFFCLFGARVAWPACDASVSKAASLTPLFYWLVESGSRWLPSSDQQISWEHWLVTFIPSFFSGQVKNNLVYRIKISSLFFYKLVRDFYLLIT